MADPRLGRGSLDERLVDRASAARADPEDIRGRRRTSRALPARERWIAEHRDELDAIVGQLLAQAARLGVEAREQDSEDLELSGTLAVLARHRDAAQYSPATLGALGLVLGDLRIHPDIEPLARNHGVHQAMAAAADRLA